MSAILIKNGHLVDPANQKDEVCDILIQDDKIAKVAANITDNEAQVIDAAGKYVMPGHWSFAKHYGKQQNVIFRCFRIVKIKA